jgi:hypothetical protein
MRRTTISTSLHSGVRLAEDGGREERSLMPYIAHEQPRANFNRGSVYSQDLSGF